MPRAIQQFAQAIQANSAAAEKTASTGEELDAQAAQMQDAISFFKVEKEDRTRPQERSLSRQGIREESFDRYRG